MRHETLWTKEVFPGAVNALLVGGGARLIGNALLFIPNLPSPVTNFTFEGGRCHGSREHIARNGLPV